MASKTVIGSVTSMVYVLAKYFGLSLIIPLYDSVTIGCCEIDTEVGGKIEDALEIESIGKAWSVATSD